MSHFKVGPLIAQNMLFWRVSFTKTWPKMRRKKISKKILIPFVVYEFTEAGMNNQLNIFIAELKIEPYAKPLIGKS